MCMKSDFLQPQTRSATFLLHTILMWSSSVSHGSTVRAQNPAAFLPTFHRCSDEACLLDDYACWVGGSWKTESVYCSSSQCCLPHHASLSFPALSILFNLMLDCIALRHNYFNPLWGNNVVFCDFWGLILSFCALLDVSLRDVHFKNLFFLSDQRHGISLIAPHLSALFMIFILGGMLEAGRVWSGLCRGDWFQKALHESFSVGVIENSDCVWRLDIWQERILQVTTIFRFVNSEKTSNFEDPKEKKKHLSWVLVLA